MRILGLAALLLVGCGPAQAVIGDGVDDTADGDTAADTGDTDTGDTAAPGDTGNTDTGSPVEPDLTAWLGKRVFSFEDVYGQGPCEETVVEEGVNVTADSDYAGALEACPDCEAIFFVETGVVRADDQELGDRMCVEQVGSQGFPVAPEVVRGIEFIGADVKIYSLRYSQWQGWSAEDLADGSLAGVDVAYEYTGNAWGADFRVTGTVEF